MGSISKISVAACLALAACTPTKSVAPPSLQIVPPSYYYRSYVLPRQPMQKDRHRRPQIVIIERTSEPTPAALYPPTNSKEADHRIEAVQREVERALKQMSRGEEK